MWSVLIVSLCVIAPCSALRRVSSTTKLKTVNEGSNQALLNRAVDICTKKFWLTLETCVDRFEDKTTFVRTGDIPQMWIRDSAAQLHPYIPLASSSTKFQSLLEGALRSQAKYITIDPYANSYTQKWNGQPSPAEMRLLRAGYVGTANYEMDSGAYFLRFLKTYTDTVPTSTVLKEPQVHEAVTTLMKLYRREQNHNFSRYEYPTGPPFELPGGSRGQPVGFTGMVWNAFRPSDDAHEFGYHIPGNLFLAGYLPFVVNTAKDVWKDDQLAEDAKQLQNEILKGVEKHGIKEVNGMKVYAYETDGLGNWNLMDDANPPSLLSIPYLHPNGEQKVYNQEVYKNTRSVVLSKKNPYFFEGSDASGIGSPHTERDMIWPLSLVMEAFTTESSERKMQLIQTLVDTAKDDLLHESFHKDDHNRITRKWFGWPNAVFAELVQSTGRSCGTVETAPMMPEPQQRQRPDFYNADVKTLRYRSIPGLDLEKA